MKIKKIGIITLIFVLLSSFSPKAALAAGITAISDTMSRLKISTLSDHTIKYTTPTGVAAGQTMTVTMPTGFTIGTVDYTDIDVSWGPTTGAENELTLAAAASGTTWGAAFTGQVLTITSGTGTITAASKVIIEIGLNATFGVAGDQQIQNHATAATYTISIGGTFTDTGKLAIVILADDQFTVSATVDPTISFSISATSTDFGVVSTSVKTASPNITLETSTNATTGYNLTIQDQGSGANPGLYNSTASYLLGSADASYNNTADLGAVAGYGIQATSATATIDARYAQSSNSVGGYERTATALASYNGVASAQQVVITSKAKVLGSAPAGSYADTVTVIATANF